MVLGGPSETFPWTLSRKTYETKELGYCHGSCPFFGGRSTFWSAWSPQPTEDLMRAFPESMLKTAREEKFWHQAKDLLNVKPASEIQDSIFWSDKDQDRIQGIIERRLEEGLGEVTAARGVESAPLSVGRRSPTSTLRFNKFSVPGPMLRQYEQQRQLAKKGKGAPLEIMLDCTVTKLARDEEGGRVVRYIETTKGVLSWVDEDTKIILCAGVSPSSIWSAYLCCQLC
ncbi:hypothetical protein ABW19_dt0207072 [Dactylella cylindrospora]|nr:hypothetical protein ABW19_dt0207072 [Dactylella cylindrospora]